jgi:hypothetical protein
MHGVETELAGVCFVSYITGACCRVIKTDLISEGVVPDVGDPVLGQKNSSQ